ncbi:MAG: HD domain-containing protein [Flavobacteriaceae bacterium]|nr:HD domain-containing protein [Flavobacteriaceae bacterium]NVJ73318.1 HD domain-containing protein [Flavobacteriaceae bacterium]
MSKNQKLFTFNDPIYGFIRIRHPFLLELIDDPVFQRLRRITQMGLSSYVFPGAQHTRFEHAIGAMYLMSKAIRVLRLKEVEISLEEEQGLLGAILLHDLGHGPYSHAMEHLLLKGVSHEDITLALMKKLNEKHNGVLDIAIEIFQGTYPKTFMNELVASQLDIDRLDYLKRDSFYTGVAEGNINSERLISMFEVIDGSLAIEEKGVFSVEKFLMARRFMYWQVYLHKTSFVAEELLLKIFKRVKELLNNNSYIFMSTSLHYFLNEDRILDDVAVNHFVQLDDVDVMYAIKKWCESEDKVLSTLCKMLIERNLLAIDIQTKKISDSKLNKIKKSCMDHLNLSKEEVDYFVFSGSIKNSAYNKKINPIALANEDNELVNFDAAKDQSFSKSLSKSVEKYYICFPKELK